MATTKQQSKILNIAMVALAAVIVVAGIAVFMLIRGGQGQPSSFVVSEKIGFANIERAGINYALDEGTALQDGDVVETLDGSEIGVGGPGETTLFLADASKMQVGTTDLTPSKAGLELLSGCMFANAQSAADPLALEGSGLTWTASDAVFVSDVRQGTVTVHMLSGDATFEDGSVLHAGESHTYLVSQEQGEAQDRSVESDASAAKTSAASAPVDNANKLTLGSLDGFALEHALDAIAAGRELVFSEDEIKGELERREAERRKLAEQAAAGKQASDASGNSASAQASAEESGDTAEGENTEQVDDGASDLEAGEQENLAEEADTGEEPTGASVADDAADEEAEEADSTYWCTIQIRCDTILDNKDSLAEGKSKYVPKSGVLLGGTSMTFTEGESVFDVLKRACSENGIALEYSYAPVYGSYYVEGIGNLYEFDCGDESGWMYKVNGWFPNYGCSEYALADGDVIEFCYTCNGLGEDVGA